MRRAAASVALVTNTSRKITRVCDTRSGFVVVVVVRVVVEVDIVGKEVSAVVRVVVEVDMVDNEVVVVVEVVIVVAVDVDMAVTVPDCGFTELCVSNVCDESVALEEVLKEEVTSLCS